MFTRRMFLGGLGAGFVLNGPPRLWAVDDSRPDRVTLSRPHRDEDVFRYIRRVAGRDDVRLCAQILGAANEFREGDEFIGVAAADAAARLTARQLLTNTSIDDIDAHPVHRDELSEYIAVRSDGRERRRGGIRTLGELKNFLLASGEEDIQRLMPELSSDVIACVVKLMANSELIRVGQRIFNPLPGSRIGAKGYLGARVQPNSPTDNVDDIRWQVLNAWAFAVGDVLLGTNPVSSDPNAVLSVEQTLQDLLKTFDLTDVMPHCVLSHIDVQAEVESRSPGSTALWFQSIAGTDAANRTFDISVEKMQQYARQRTGPFGLYFETGQGADFTNGHAHGFDMVIHESRKYGFARALSREVSAVDSRDGTAKPWVHLNDVAGFIGPEVFRTREQLVRCCLEDIVMGKLHGLCLGLDVCSTLHMDVSLDDLDWCMEQIVPANPAYLMALPTKIDPMLGYLTTGYQDHVRLRERFGYRVDDSVWAFFQRLGVIDAKGQPTRHFGDPLWVYLQYRRQKEDRRSDAAILEEGRRQLADVRSRGLFIAEGYGDEPWDLPKKLAADIRRIYDDAKISIRAELQPEFVKTIPNVVRLSTLSGDRDDYILHPATGEQLSEESIRQLKSLRRRQKHTVDVQIVISDGLNALAISEPGQLAPFLNHLRDELRGRDLRVAHENLLVTSGRVRAGYRIGELLFGELSGPRAILHVIGERPGTGHRTFSVYMTAPQGNVWGGDEAVDHNITKVVSGIARTALKPVQAADEVVRLLESMIAAA